MCSVRRRYRSLAFSDEVSTFSIFVVASHFPSTVLALRFPFESLKFRFFTNGSSKATAVAPNTSIEIRDEAPVKEPHIRIYLEAISMCLCLF